MKIVVLVKQVPDTWGERRLDPKSGRLDRSASDAVIDEIDERAVEVALQYKDSTGAEVVVASMGPADAKDVLRKALAMGADSAVHVLDNGLEGADLLQTSAVLAAAIRKLAPDLVVAGNESTDGRGGVIPAMIAEALGQPAATFLSSVEISADSVSGTRADEYGSSVIKVALPAVISVTEASAEPRFPNFKGIMSAKKKPLEVWSIGDLGVDTKTATTVRSVAERPARTAGTKIVDQGDAGQQLADFLAAGHLI
jgi:electron transfer flavoprotein beta subunit